MTHHQWETIERSLIDLSTQDKLELVERLIHELWVTAVSGSPSPTPPVMPITEEEFKRQLLNSGLMSNLPTPSDPGSRPTFQPITLDGEPLSETIIRDRR